MMNINIDAKQSVKHLLEKITSGRWIMVVSLTLTYCVVILGLTYAVIKKIIPIEVFLGVWAGFTPMMILMNEWYFKRQRAEENGASK